MKRKSPKRNGTDGAAAADGSAAAAAPAADDINPATGKPWQVTNGRRDHLKSLTRLYYDMQALRVGAGNRTNPTAPEASSYLDPQGVETLDKISTRFKGIEADVVKLVDRAIRDLPIGQWLESHDGVGPCMAGLLLAEVSLIPVPPHKRADGTDHPGYPDPFGTVSKLWRFFGLDVRDGHAPRRKKGERAGFDPWLRSKATAVLGGNIIKTCTRAEPDEEKLAAINKARAKDGEEPLTLQQWIEAVKAKGFTRRLQHPWMEHAVYIKGPWVPLYYDKRHRQESMRIRCMGCDGTGKRVDPTGTAGEKRAGKAVPCWNCDATGGPAPWGRGPDHRHQDGVRYLVKMFLQAFILTYREQENLPNRPPYREEKLGMQPHGGHGGWQGGQEARP